MESARTLLKEIAAALNCRALTYLSHDGNTSILRPKDLFGRTNTTCLAFFEPYDFSDEEYRQGRLSSTQKLHKFWLTSSADFIKFWTKFYEGYLPMLRDSIQREHRQGLTADRAPKVGAVVSVITPGCPPGTWPFARIVELPNLPLSMTRQATIKTPQGNIVKRSLKLLCPLEADLFETRENTESQTQERIITHANEVMPQVEQRNATSIGKGKNERVRESLLREAMNDRVIMPIKTSSSEMSKADSQHIPPNAEANQAAEPISEHDEALADTEMEEQTHGGDDALDTGGAEAMEAAPAGTLASETGTPEVIRHHARYALRPQPKKAKPFTSFFLLASVVCLCVSATQGKTQNLQKLFDQKLMEVCEYPPRDMRAYHHQKRLTSESFCSNGTWNEIMAPNCLPDEKLVPITGKPCHKASIFVFRKFHKPQFCYSSLNCLNGDGRVHLVGKRLECGSCKCPNWATDCVFFDHEDITAENLLETFEKHIVLDQATQSRLMEQVRPAECRIANEPVTDKNRHCTRAVSIKYHLVQLTDFSEHFVDEFHVQKRELIYAKEKCYGFFNTEGNYRAKRDAQTVACPDGLNEKCAPGATKFCYHPVTEIATFLVNSLLIPVRAWGSVSTTVYRPDTELSQYDMSCELCVLKCLDDDSFTIGWGSKVTNVEFCHPRGCEPLLTNAKITGIRRPFNVNYHIPRFLRVQWWHDGILLKAEETVCPIPDPCKQVDCYACTKFFKFPECNPKMVIVIVILCTYLVVQLSITAGMYVYKCIQGYRKRRQNQLAIQNGSSNAIAMRDIRMVEYHAVPTSDGGECQITHRRAPSAAYVPRFGGLQLRAGPSNISPIPEISDDDDQNSDSEQELAFNYHASTPAITSDDRPISPVEVMQGEVARMSQNLAEIALNEVPGTSGTTPNVLNNFRKIACRTMQNLFVLTFAAQTINLANACSISTSVTATTEQCVQSDELHMECSFRQSIMLSFPTQGQSNCVLFSNSEDRPFGNVKLTIPFSDKVCKKDTRFFTRDYVMKTSSSRRCVLVGSCGYETCGNVSLDTHISELGNFVNQAPGFTKCADTPGGWTAGCFVFHPSCLFYRSYANAIDDKIGTVFRCVDWKTEISVHIEIQQSHKLQKEVVKLRLDEPQVEVKGISISLISLTSDTSTAILDEFVTDNIRTAVLPNYGDQFAPQCNTTEEAKAFNESCKISSTACECRPASNHASCDCREFRPMTYLSNKLSLLPKDVGGVRLKQVGGRVISETKAANIQLQLSMDGFKLKTKIDFSRCEIESSRLLGCGDCGQGAEFSYVCSTNFGESLGFISCPSANFSVHCTNEKIERKTHLTLPSGRFSESCMVRCPNSTSQIKISGMLHLAPNMDEVIDHFVASNFSEIQTTPIDWLIVFTDHMFEKGYKVWTYGVAALCTVFGLFTTTVLAFWMLKSSAQAPRATAIILFFTLATTATTDEAPTVFAFRCPQLLSGKAAPSKQQDALQEVIAALKCAQAKLSVQQGPSKQAVTKKTKPKLISDENFAGCAIPQGYRIPKVKVVTGSNNGCILPKQPKVVKNPSSSNGKTYVNTKFALNSKPNSLPKPYEKPQHLPAKNKPLVKQFFQPAPPPAPKKQEIRKQKEVPKALHFTLQNLFPGGYRKAEHGKKYISLGNFLQQHYGLAYESLAEFLKSEGGRKAFEYALGSATVYSGISKREYAGAVLTEETAGGKESPVFENMSLGEQVSYEFGGMFIDKELLLVLCGGEHTWPIETLYLKRSEWA